MIVFRLFFIAKTYSHSVWIIAWLVFKSKAMHSYRHLQTVNSHPAAKAFMMFIFWKCSDNLKKKKGESLYYSEMLLQQSFKFLAHAKSTIIHYSNGFTLKCYLMDFNLPISPKLERVRNGCPHDCMLRWHFHCSARHQFQSLFSWKSNWCIPYIKSKLKVTPLCVKGLVGVTSTITPLAHSGPPFIQFSFFIRS